MHRFEIYCHFDNETKKWSGYSLLRYNYTDKLDYKYDHPTSSDWVMKGVSLYEIMIYCDLCADIELRKRDRWEEVLNEDEDCG